MPIGVTVFLSQNTLFLKDHSFNWHVLQNPYLIFFCLGPLLKLIAPVALWAKIRRNVKKPPLRVNDTNFEFFGFSISIWVPIIQRYVEKQGAFWTISKISLNRVFWFFWYQLKLWIKHKKRVNLQKTKKLAEYISSLSFLYIFGDPGLLCVVHSFIHDTFQEKQTSSWKFLPQ